MNQPRIITKRDKALLVLEDGTIMKGYVYGSVGRCLGEIVFSTGMTGYQETFSDPSYRRQIIVMTSPHIGNTGVNEEDSESGQFWAAGVVVRDPSPISSNWRATKDLESSLEEAGVVGICGVDTRALTLHVREHGAMRAGIFSGSDIPAGGVENEQSRALLVSLVRQSEQMAGASLAGEVSTDSPYEIPPVGEEKCRVVAVDLGIKTSTPRELSLRGARVIVLPHDADFELIEKMNPDGVFFSNGPGDPSTATHQVNVLRSVLERGYPFFGICFGHQLLGRALGFGTYKLAYGHRGVNQPVVDKRSGKVDITAHNHGFAVDAPTQEASVAPFGEGAFGRVEVSHVCLNDGVVEGLRCLDIPAFSVQYHPEAAAGPHDASHLFDSFISMILQKGRKDA